MRKFKGMKDLEQVQKDAKEQGWVVDTTRFDQGDDWFWLRDLENRVLQVGVNCFGKFMVFAPVSEKPIATERSIELENEDWYNEILDLLYEPLS